MLQWVFKKTSSILNSHGFRFKLYFLDNLSYPRLHTKFTTKKKISFNMLGMEIILIFYK